jgi:DNA primase
MNENWVDFKAVKAAVSMEMVLARYGVKVRRSNQFYVRGPCPLPTHKTGDSNQSFGVNTSKNAWACQSQSCVAGRGGKKGGNVLDFVALMESCTIRDAALKLQEWFMIGPSQDQPKQAAPEKRVAEKNEPGSDNDGDANPPLSFTLKGVDTSHPYLASRGITRDTAETFGVGFFPGRGTMSGRVVIPIHNSGGELVAYAGRCLDESEPRYKLPASFRKSHELFNLHRAIDSRSRVVAVVEGFFDAMTIHQAGFPCVVALMGSSLSDNQEALLAASFDRVILMLDGDEAGRVASCQIAGRLSFKLFVRAIPLLADQQPDKLSSDEISRLIASVEVLR